MFELEAVDDSTLRVKGRLDAARAVEFESHLRTVSSSLLIDCTELEYISSAGLGELFAAQKRLSEAGEAIRLTGLNAHLRDVFAIAGFDTFFEID